MEEKFNQSKTLRSCKLTKDDLLELVNEIYKKCFSKPGIKVYFNISTELLSSKISSNNIKKFLENKKLPVTLTGLTIFAAEQNSIDKSIYLNFSETIDRKIYLNITGKDEIWVLGTFQYIYNFLKAKKTWYWFFNLGLASKYIIIIIDIIILKFFTMTIIHFYKLNEKPYYIIISFTVFLITWIWFTVGFFKEKIFPYTQIILKPKQSFLSKNYDKIIAIFTILIFVATVIGIMIGK